jgi:hypothetical protein
MINGKRIAVVGLSNNPMRAAWRVASYLKSAGKEIIPVNPNFTEVMGLTCYPRISAIPGPVDVVDVFRRPEYCADVARDAIDAGAKGIWLQSGITNSEARRLAEEAGIYYVEDHCLMVEHMHHAR